MNLQEFLQIGIVGIGLSFVVEMIKARFGLESDTTKMLVIVLSVVLGAGYFFLSTTSLWLPIVGILGTATTFYSLFMRK